MRLYLFVLLAQVGLFFNPLPALAVEHSLIPYNAKGPWSEVLQSNFDGPYVNDRHNKVGGERDTVVTQWSPAEIRATFRDYRVIGVTNRTVTKYRTKRRCRDRGDDQKEECRTIRVPYTEVEPVKQWAHDDYAPSKIQFAIGGDRYTYTSGPVPADLATALANAPNGNMLIRLIFDTRPALEYEIGAGTVEAWRQVFGGTSALR